MLLAAAAEWADSNPERVPPTGFAGRVVRRRIELAADGRLLQLVDLATVEHKGGLKRTVPDLTRSGTKAPALLVSDKASYVLGPGPTTGEAQVTRAQGEHARYLALLDECLAATGDPAMQAVRAFVGGAPYSLLRLPADWTDGDVIDFFVEGNDPLASAAVQGWWAARYVSRTISDRIGTCFVCGRTERLVRLFPQLKGIPGGQSSGSPLISFNKAAHEHYGLDHSSNAPACGPCAQRSHDALAVLLSDDRHARTVGSLRWVWWSLGGDELPIDSLLFEPDPGEVKAMLESAHSGRPGGHIDTGRFVAVALGGNSGRTVVRAWLEAALSDAQASLARWFGRQAIVDRDGSPPRPLPLWQLVAAAAPAAGKKEGSADPAAARRILPRLVEAALLGQSVPPLVWQGAIGRIRATGDVSRSQAAVLKLGLVPVSDPAPEVTMTQLDPNRTEPAYHCGRLLAVMDQTQRAALGRLNSTMIDRYYGSASSSPATVMPVLIRGVQPHLAKLRRTRPGAAIAYERRLTEILDSVDRLPPSLTLRQQGEFALGYYHQRAADIAAARVAKAAGVSEAEAPLAEEDIPDTEED
jgi:CRISPR-associated protein Csd1